MARRRFYRKKRKLKAKRFFSFILKASFILVILGVLASFSVFAYYARNLPDPAQAIKEDISVTSKIYARDGETLLYEIHGDQKRIILSSNQIPKNIKQATVAVEDEDFYHHMGIDLPGIIRAVWVNIKRGGLVQGGSTITQQFIKNSILTPEKTIERKIKEWVLALELERQYSKDKILTFYLNQVPYGRTAYGIEAATETYFGKQAGELTLSEAATLASLPKAPTYYGTHPEKLKTRRDYVLVKMHNLGYISAEKLKETKKEKIKFTPHQVQMKAPHFVTYIRSLLEKKLGSEVIERRSRKKGGLKVVTTLDWELQKKAQKMVKKAVEEKGEYYNASNASLVAVDPQNGDILTMVGSRDFFSEEVDGQVNVTLRPRQPGSSFKPLVYATAIEKGFTPQTILFDVTAEFNPHCPADSSQSKDQYGLKCYHPSNYDEKTRGPVSFRSALAQSLNIPAVKVLYLAGVKNTINHAEKAGISTFEDEKRLGLSMALGGAEVKLLELTSAFGIFTQDGYHIQPNPIKKVEGLNPEQEQKLLPSKDPTRVFSQKTSRAVADILSDNKARAPMFGSASALYIPGIPTGAKTGTSQKYRDAWTVGFSPQIAAGVWVGNNDSTKMRHGAVGAAIAAPIWNEFMRTALEGKPHPDFPEPKSFEAEKPMLNGSLASEEKIKIDKISGKKATEYTPESLIVEKTYNQAHSILHYVNKANPQGQIPESPGSDPQYENWAKAVKKWIEDQPDSSAYNQSPPSEYDDIHTPGNRPEVHFKKPEDGDRITDNNLKIELDAEAKLDLKQIDLFLDSDYLKTINEAPWETEVTIPVNSETCQGEHTLKAKAYDEVLNSKEEEIEITTKFSCPDKTINLNLQIEEENKKPSQLILETDKKVTGQRVRFYYYQVETPTQINFLGEQRFDSPTPSFSYKIAKELKTGEYVFYARLLDENSQLHQSEKISYTLEKQ